MAELLYRSGDQKKFLALDTMPESANERFVQSYMSSTFSLCYPGCQLVMSVGWRQASSCPLYAHGLTKKTTYVCRKGCVNAVPRSGAARKRVHATIAKCIQTVQT